MEDPQTYGNNDYPKTYKQLFKFPLWPSLSLTYSDLHDLITNYPIAKDLIQSLLDKDQTEEKAYIEISQFSKIKINLLSRVYYLFPIIDCCHLYCFLYRFLKKHSLLFLNTKILIKIIDANSENKSIFNDKHYIDLKDFSKNNKKINLCVFCKLSNNIKKPINKLINQFVFAQTKNIKIDATKISQNNRENILKAINVLETSCKDSLCLDFEKYKQTIEIYPQASNFLDIATNNAIFTISTDNIRKTRELISIFRTEIELKNKKSILLIKPTEANRNPELRMYGINNNELFETILINNQNNELLNELNKDNPNENKIENFIASFFGRTLVVDKKQNNLSLCSARFLEKLEIETNNALKAIEKKVKKQLQAFTPKPRKQNNFEWYVKRDCDDQVYGWLTRHNRGTLLITGYRGIGKTSCVEFALEKLNNEYKKQTNKENNIQVININLSKILSLKELVVLILRQIANKFNINIKYIQDDNCFQVEETDDFSPNSHHLELKSSIENFLLRLNTKVEASFTASSSLGSELGGDILPDITGKVKVQNSENMSHKLTYLDMPESEIVTGLNYIIQEYIKDSKNNERLILVFDEIDKIKGFQSNHSEDGKMSDFEELVGHIKLILSESNATFIFVAGQETFNRWEVDKSRGSSVYSSVFDHVIDVEPFLRGRSRSICSSLQEQGVDSLEQIKDIVNKHIRYKYYIYNEYSLPNRTIIESFYKYLLWKSRGIPKRVIQELEYYICTNTSNTFLIIDTINIRKIKFYSILVKELYDVIVIKELLDNDGILNMIARTEALLKFHRTGFNYDDLKLLTVAVDQDMVFKNEYYYELAIKLLEGWWINTCYGRRARYVFDLHIKAEINLLSNEIQDEAVAFTFDYNDFKGIYQYFTETDERVENQVNEQRINSLRIQAGLGKINMLMKNDYKAIEYYKKAIRLGTLEIDKERDKANSDTNLGNVRLLVRIMTECYIEIGYILERKKKIREAMTFYTSAFYNGYRNYIKANYRYNFSFTSLLSGSKDFQLFDKFYVIPEESIDALNHMAYIQWKTGSLDDAKKLFHYALKLSYKRYNKHKTASQMLLLGFFYFRMNNIDLAIKYFNLTESTNTTPEAEAAKEEDRISNDTDAPLPKYLINISYEAQACCFFAKSEIKNTKGFDNALEYLEKAISNLNSDTNQRHIVRILMYKLRTMERVLRNNRYSDEKKYYSLINSIFRLVRNRMSDDDKEEKEISMKDYFHLCGMVTWQIFSRTINEIGKPDPNNITLQSKSFMFLSKLTNDLFQQCKPFFISIAKKCKGRIDKCLENKDEMDYHPCSHLLADENIRNSPESISKIRDIFINVIENETPPKDIEQILLFIEQIFLLCHRFFNKYIFTITSSYPGERLGCFYFWIYNHKDDNKKNIFSFNNNLYAAAESFFNYALQDQHTYQKYLLDRFYSIRVCNLFLGDIYYLKWKEGKGKQYSNDLGKKMEERNERLWTKRRCIKYYSIALTSIANEIEINLGKNPLHPDVYFKEISIIPITRMHNVANNRYRLQMIFEKNSKRFMTNEFNFLENHLDDQEKTQKCCRILRKAANEINEDDEKNTEENIWKLRELLKMWRYYDDITTDSSEYILQSYSQFLKNISD